MSAMKSSLATLSALAFTASVCAAPDLDTRVHELEKRVDAISTKTVMGNYGPELASARPDPHGTGWFLTLDVLYWHAKAGGTEYVYTNAYPAFANLAPATTPRTDGHIKDIDFEWKWGFKVGVGHNFDHDGWDGFVQYTYFDADGNSRADARGQSALLPNRGNNMIVNETGTVSFVYCTRATSEMEFDFDAVDAELGRNYFVSRSLSFRPHFGIKSVWLELDQLTRYTGGDGLVASTEIGGLSYNTVYVKDKSKLWGMGPRAGFNSKWHLTDGFSMYGNVSASMLYSYFQTSTKDNYSPDVERVIRLKSKFHKFVPMAEFGIGLSYDRYVYNDKQHVGVSLGYEVQYLWRANQMIKADHFQNLTHGSYMAYDRYSEDASMHGVTLEIRWDF